MKHAAVTGATPTTVLNGRPRRMTDTTGFPRACLARVENGAAPTQRSAAAMNANPRIKTFVKFGSQLACPR